MICLALFGALMILPVRAPAQIFECFDADGKREFAQKCSPGTVRQREVSKGGASNPDGVNVQAQPSLKQEEAGFQQRRLQREAGEAKEKTAAEDAARKCRTARSHLTTLESRRPMPNGADPKTGEAKYLDDNEREAEKKKARDSIATYCK